MGLNLSSVDTDVSRPYPFFGRMPPCETSCGLLVRGKALIYEPLVRCARRLRWEVRCAQGIAEACRIIARRGKDEVPGVVRPEPPYRARGRDAPRSRADVRTAQKLESIGMLAGGIAHDFNNTLTAIMGNLARARLHISDSWRVTEALTEAETASWRARRLTQRLLTFARGGAPIKRPGSLAALLGETVPSVLAGANVR